MGEDVEYLTLNESRAFIGSVGSIRDNAIVTTLLTTGLYLNELEHLTVDSINWKEKTLTVPGNKSRTIPLNDQAYNALASWSQDRIDSQETSLFVTTKGVVSPLSARSIDHHIRKYGQKAGIEKKVNARLLRNTFAINLFSTDIHPTDAADILGISDYPTISKYKNAAKSLKTNTPNIDTSQTDTRSIIHRILTKLLPKTPKEAKVLSKLKGQLNAHPEEVIFGRVTIVQTIETCLKRTQSVLISGPVGIGRTHILKHIHSKFPHSIFLPQAGPLKTILKTICTSADTG